MGAGFTDSGLVVCQPNGKPFRPESMTQKWGRFVKKHGLKKIRFHDLRHSCTTMNTYAHCTPAMDQSAADKLDNILFA